MLRMAVFLLAIFLNLSTTWGKVHVITSGPIKAFFKPQTGLNEVQFNGRTVLLGSSTASGGALFTLTRNVPTKDWHWPKNKDTCHFAPSVGKLIKRIGSRTKHETKVLHAGKNRYVVAYYFEDGLTLVFDHRIKGLDIICRVTVDNESQDFYQLHDWLSLKLNFTKKPTIFQKMGSYYPAANIYSPVTAAWDDKIAVGMNFIEHDSRSVEIRFQHAGKKNKGHQWRTNLWLKNAPVPAHGQASYTMVFRVSDRVGDWKYLLTPYKTWFNQFYGPVTYTADFRVKVASFVANGRLVTRINPHGMRHNLHNDGWGAYIKKRLLNLQSYNISHILFWAVTGSNPRGVNYRPEFNIMPPMLRRTMFELRDFCRRSGMKYGFFARPNAIAYQRTWNKDDDVDWNPLEHKHVRMADRRFDDLVQLGADAFYLDTYGSAVGCSPYSAQAAVYYLKHLRERLGPDFLIFTEHGFDAYHVFAPIWPSGGDKHGKKPLGPFAHWLTPGSYEICRSHDLQGAIRSWALGGIPLVRDDSIRPELKVIQQKYVKENNISITRPDCKPTGSLTRPKSRVPFNKSTSPQK